MKYNATASAITSDNVSISGSSEYRENTLLLQMIVLCILAILGVGGNITILVTSARRLFCVSQVRLRQEYRTPFITNLAVSDILTLVYGVPLHLSQEKRVPMSEFVCRYLVPLRDVLVLISILTIMAISLERAFAIVNPFSLETSRHYTKYWIIIIWIVAYLLAALPMVFVMTSSGEFCLPRWSDIKLQKAHQTSAVLLIIIPGLITTCSYSFCLRSLRKFRQRRKASTESTGVEQWSFIQQSRSVSRIAVVLVAVFWICNLPFATYAICVTHQLITPSSENHAYTSTILVCMFFANSVVNPIVLITMSPLYRKSAAACVCYVFLRGHKIIRSRVQYSKDSTNKSERISIANHESAGENNANVFALTARKLSVGVE